MQTDKEHGDLRELANCVQEETSVASRSLNEEMWRKLAGERLPEMLASAEQTAGFVDDSDWRVRIAALSILRTKWGPTAELAQICERLAFTDSHQQVRECALFTLAYCFKGTMDARIARILVDVVHNLALPETFRRAAYRGLFLLRGSNPGSWPKTRGQLVPGQLDWQYVDEFERALAVR